MVAEGTVRLMGVMGDGGGGDGGGEGGGGDRGGGDGGGGEEAEEKAVEMEAGLRVPTVVLR